ncbi:MAG TPA: MBL fold metallo-hydrolase [Candidatus Polarisedimenticolia bacterium]|nr:MBL fold metallo-hydrolase [Candidatus Polarisedimenticolia bacterium]
MKKHAALGCLMLVVGPGICLAQSHHDRPAGEIFKRELLSGGVYALYGRGGNVGFMVGPDAVLVVDSQFENVAPGIIEQIRSVTDRPIKYLVNTHYHADHVGGNPVFRPFSLIVAHDNVRKRMLASPAEILKEYPEKLEAARQKGDKDSSEFYATQIEWAKKVKVEEIAAPYLTFDSELRLHLGEETVQLWHTPPAHTDGDCVVYFEKANVLHGGDLIWNRLIPFIDVKGGGSARGYATALEKVLSRVPTDAKVIPGHGQVMDVAGLKEFRKYITDLLALADGAKKKGISREEFLKSAELPAYKEYSGYSDRFKDNCAAAYDEAR